MVDLTCEEAARVMGLDASCWPDVCVPVADLLNTTFDDEGATVCYAGKTWRNAQVADVLRHPTSLAFLSRQGVVAYHPAAIISAAFGASGHLRCNLQTMWGHEIRSNKEQSFLLLDIVQNVTARAGLDRDNTLNERQQAWIASMVSKIRAIENPDDCGTGNE